MSMEKQATEPQAMQAKRIPDDEIDLVELLIIIAKHNRFIVKLTIGAAVLSVIVAVLLPNIYTAKTMIMPPQQSQSSAASMMMGQIGALGGLVGLDKTPSDLYVAMMKSRSIEDVLIKSHNLLEVYDVKTYMAARRQLEDKVRITADKQGMISLEFDDKDAKRAADVANSYIDELDNLVRKLAVSEASRRRLFFENQLKEIRGNLETSELAMKQLQERTGVIQLEGQSGSILGAEAGLRAQIAAKEIELSAMRSFATQQNPDYLRVAQMIASMRAQLAKLTRDSHPEDGEMATKGEIPRMSIEYIHKMRDLKYNEKLFEFIEQQLASARIDEAKDAAVIQIVDKAVPPEKKSKPLRAVIVLFAAVAALFIGILGAFMKETIERMRKNAGKVERMTLLRRYLRQGNTPG